MTEAMTTLEPTSLHLQPRRMKPSEPTMVWLINDSECETGYPKSSVQACKRITEMRSGLMVAPCLNELELITIGGVHLCTQG